MSYSESDRIAHLAHIAKLERELKIAEWLKANPEVGELNNPAGGKIYYVMVAREQVIVIPPCDIKSGATDGMGAAKEESGFYEINWADQEKASEVFDAWYLSGCNGKQALIFAEVAVVQHMRIAG